MTKTLTEQWKDGELTGGLYYIKLKDGLIFTDRTRYEVGEKMYRWEITDYHYVAEVLAPVPSYEEFIQQRDFVKDHTKVLIENMNLKRKLEIATKALKEYANCKPTEWMSCVTADKALKEMEGVK